MAIVTMFSENEFVISRRKWIIHKNKILLCLCKTNEVNKNVRKEIQKTNNFKQIELKRSSKIDIIWLHNSVWQKSAIDFFFFCHRQNTYNVL